MVENIPVEKIRNIGFIAHIDAGKTTTTEKVLYFTGKTHRAGEVDSGTTQMDWMQLERERGITIQSAVTTTFYREHQINIIDTPGHVDFTIEVEKAIHVLDGLVVIFDGVAGVQPQSETVWHQADKKEVSRIVFINKLDRPGADYDFAIDDIQKKFGVRTVALNIPYYEGDELKGTIDLFKKRLYIRDQDNDKEVVSLDIPDDIKETVESRRSVLLETVFEHYDDILALYLNDQEVSEERFHDALRGLVLSGDLVPVLAGSSLKNIGIYPLLDAISAYLPSPEDIPPVKAWDPKSEKEVQIKPLKQNDFLGYVFKIVKDPYLDKFAFVRIYSGSLTKGQVVLNDTTGIRERILKIFMIHANSKTEVEKAAPGNFVGIAGLKSTRTGDTITSENFNLQLDNISTPNPVISLAIEPHSNKDYDKLISVLDDMQIEDPSFRHIMNNDTGQLIIYGMGELHLEIIIHRIKNEQGILIKSGEPRVSYRETIKKTLSKLHTVISNETGTAEITVDIEPIKGSIENIVEFRLGKSRDKIPSKLIDELKEASRIMLQIGVLGGYPLIGVKLTIKELEAPGDYIPNLFKMAVSDAVIRGLKSAEPMLLEPYMKFELYTPEEYFGEVFNSINQKNSEIADVEIKGPVRIIKGFVPLAKVFNYTSELRSLTQGRGSINLEFKDFRPLPENEKDQLLNFL